MNEILAAMDTVKYGLSLRRIALIFLISFHLKWLFWQYTEIFQMLCMGEELSI
jgi:hypothetical protein